MNIKSFMFAPKAGRYFARRLFGVMVFLAAFSCMLYAQKTEVVYLSGTGTDSPVTWEFFCTDGRNSGKWTTIPVPSNWELQGFGKYNYGHAKDSVRGKEEGLYRYKFGAPEAWKGRQVNIVFEGSMTDTEVKINGKPAGQVHQGSFYRFRSDISELLKYGQSNILEVRVAKHSANNSVNKAERHGDFWIFGGIFRPVYLEAKPTRNIGHVAINARANGAISAEVFLKNAVSADKITVQVADTEGNIVAAGLSVPVEKGNPVVRFETKIQNIKPWNPEDPNLYKIVFRLQSKGRIVHEVTEQFGFRTVEVRERDGIYVNDVKVKFKGVNRHTFRPGTGRASCKAFSIEDVKLIKEMNMNAVRMSHYPPDKHFLEVCDSLGLFVIDELTGWHNAYDTETGTRLVRQMVERDVNHPSVILWSNGNEGGSNPELDPVFKQYDIQKRSVIHPWMVNEGMITEHYINYDYGMGTYWNGHDIAFPTEFLHGLYDGGLGAGLYDFWELIWNRPRAAGGFLWVLADEGVVRTDKGGIIDTYGDAAPDGILGPHHEKEGSFFAIKEIWSPVRFEEKDITAAFDGRLNIENRYLYSNINTCTFKWKLAKMPMPWQHAEARFRNIDTAGKISGTAGAPDIAPGAKGQLKLDLPSGWHDFDVLYVTATDKSGMDLYTWSWPVSLPKDVVRRMIYTATREKTKALQTDTLHTKTLEPYALQTQALHPDALQTKALQAKPTENSKVTVVETDSLLIVHTSGIELTICRNDGVLKKVINRKGEIPFNNGPVLSAGESIFEKTDVQTIDDKVKVTCSFADGSRMKETVWTIYPSGWVKLHVMYVPPEYDVHFDYMGINFSYPEDKIKAVRWFGDGPYRVWKNRMHGVESGVHQKEYNNTITGVSPLIYPEFKGYHSRLYWAEIIAGDQSFTVATASEDIFMRLFTPAQPEKTHYTEAGFPDGDISFMHGIPPIGTKSQQPWRLGPSGQKNQFFDYGPYDNWRRRCKEMILFFDFSPE